MPSFFHANASMIGVYATLMAKATFAMGKRFSLRSFWDEMAMYKVTHTNVMGSILVLLMKQEPKPDDAKYSEGRQFSSVDSGILGV